MSAKKKSSHKKKKLSLFKLYCSALRDVRQITANSYLTHLSGAVEEIDKAGRRNAVLKGYVEKLVSIVERQNFALNPEYTDDFAQILGEAHFYFLSAKRGVRLDRVPESKVKTPDFKFKKKKVELFFEVKTLSVVNGAVGIGESLYGGLEAQIGIEKQLMAGKRYAMSTTVIQPYGNNQSSITTVINKLLEKARGNIKQGQYKKPNTFLVLNLSIIPPLRTESFVLRPAYCDDHLFSKAVTGELWMLGFGNNGMLIHGMPEFEGKPCIEGTLEKIGILADPEFSYVAGLLLMIHPWKQPSEIWGLFRSQDMENWNSNHPEIIKTLLKITGNNWNDCRDSNGWQLKG